MATKLDAVCLALSALWTPALPTVRVVDGPQAASEDAPEWLFISYDADRVSETVEGAIVRQQWIAGNRQREETGDVTCAIVVRSGDTDIRAVRARAVDILSDCEDALRTDYMLGGLVMQSGISESRFIPTITQTGSKVRVVFTVAYMAHL